MIKLTKLLITLSRVKNKKSERGTGFFIFIPNYGCADFRKFRNALLCGATFRAGCHTNPQISTIKPPRGFNNNCCIYINNQRLIAGMLWLGYV